MLWEGGSQDTEALMVKELLVELYMAEGVSKERLTSNGGVGSKKRHSHSVSN